MPSPSPTGTATPLPILTLVPSVTPTETPQPAAGRIPILEYHYSDFQMTNQVMMTAAWYSSQIQWLAQNGFTSLSAADLVNYLNGESFPVKSVVL